jgi:sugar lactone lactonase YvrE/uncharacterized Zn finger protein (UPF0148 family)
LSDIFSCPTCGAPLTYQAGDGSTILCPYCRNSVIVPAELHPDQPAAILHDRLDELLLPQIRDFLARSQKIEAIKLVRQHTGIGLKEALEAVNAIEVGTRTSLADLTNIPFQAPDANIYVPAQASPGQRRVAMGITVVVGMFFLLLGLVIMMTLRQPAPQVIEPTEAPTATAAPMPTLVPTPQFASPVSSFGSEGIGAGKFSQANSLAVDPAGNLYVGDYVGNRVQVFDPTGKFVVQWTLDPSVHIRHLAAGLNGELYANLSGRIFRYDSKTGQQTGEVKYTDATDGDIDDFDAIAVGLDDSLLVTWINNTQETDTLLRFDPSGKLLQTIAGPIQVQTGEFDPDINLALDGLGDIYAVGEISNTICEYSPQGKLITRFGSKGSQPGQIDNVENIAIDSRGRLYVSDFMKVQVFDASGRYLDSFAIFGGGYVITFDRQDNLYSLNTTKVTKFALREK